MHALELTTATHIASRGIIALRNVRAAPRNDRDQSLSPLPVHGGQQQFILQRIHSTQPLVKTAVFTNNRRSDPQQKCASFFTARVKLNRNQSIGEEIREIEVIQQLSVITWALVRKATIGEWRAVMADKRTAAAIWPQPQRQ